MRRTRRERRSEGRCPWIQLGPIKSPHGGGRKPRPRPHLCRSCHGCVVENEAVELLMVNSYNQNHVLTLHQCCKCPFVKPLSYTLSLLGTRQSNYRAVLVIRHPQTTRADTEIDSHTHTHLVQRVKHCGLLKSHSRHSIVHAQVISPSLIIRLASPKTTF